MAAGDGPARVLALDYGSARCGCALSDPSGTLATPVEPVLRPASRAGLRALAALVASEDVGHVIVGLPLSLSGGDSEQTRETRRFAEALGERLGARVPVELYDERFTTKLAAGQGAAGRVRGGGGASRGGGGGGASRRGVGAARAAPTASEDSRAAAILLQSWLDSRRA
ncbi:MAG TPA: Holliday junction resolvase RuvX [Solirubrobacteraceae bacterium]|nr:Holliday junction resolvase RuvX [Solirubrobacteraceae bacterium]